MKCMGFRNGWVLRVEAPARIHCGLLEICPGEKHCYGGLGFTVDQPGLIVEARVSDLWQTDPRDPWQARIEAIAEFWREYKRRVQLPRTQVRVISAPLAHSGLGTGTQLAAAVVTLLETWYLWDRGDLKPPPLTDARQLLDQIWSGPLSLAQTMVAVTGRGARSHIGVNGFLYGGWIFDLGLNPTIKPVIEPAKEPTGPWALLESVYHALKQKRDRSPRHPNPTAAAKPNLDADVLRAVMRHRAAPEWWVVLATPEVEPGASGITEAEYFQVCATRPNENRAKMLDLIQTVIGPGIEQHDLDRVGPALHEFGQLAGALFARVQNGCYRGPAVKKTVAWLRDCGAAAVGQSSWGPTVFALVASEDVAKQIVEQMQSEKRVPLVSLDISPLNRHGAKFLLKAV